MNLLSLLRSCGTTVVFALVLAAVGVSAVWAQGTAASSSTMTSALPSASAASAAPRAGGALPAAPSLPASTSGFRIRPVDDAWRAALPRDPTAATQAYMDRLPADVVARSNAYFEGRNWLQLWNWLAGLAVSALLLSTPWSTGLRDRLERRLRRPPLRDAAYGAAWVATGWLLVLPLTVYEHFVREHAYGMATQTIGAWFGEQLMTLLVSVVVGGLLVMALYAVLRRVGASWWLWGAAVTIVFMTIAIALGPVFIEPLFNTYKPVEEGPVKTAVLSMAHANGVPVDNVYVFDASRQTTRVSANVSGLFGTAAIRLNDNLLRRTSEAEVRAVMGHEIGHYAMNHIPKMLMMFGVVILVGFGFAQWAMQRLLARYGGRWGLRGAADVASLPLLAAVLSTYLLLATPVINGITRSQETEADLWGLNLAREPHGEAEVLLRLAEYRKPDPGALEELIFFTHPSTRTRIFHAMRWREQMLPPPR
jgi:STE24 endopeptidase